MIYEGSPAKHLPGMAALIFGKLKDRHRCFYMNSPAMIAGLRTYLAAADVDVTGEIRAGALVLTSDQSQLANGHFDTIGMLGKLVQAVKDARRDGYKGLWASGDMTWELGSDYNPDVLLEYEYGLEQVFRRYPTLSGICQYHRDTLPTKAIQAGVLAHRALYVNETLSRINPEYGLDDESDDPTGLELPSRLDVWLRDLRRTSD